MDDDYIGPQYQLMPPRDALKDLQEFAQKLGIVLGEVGTAIINGFSVFANRLIDAVCDALRGVSRPPTRSKLRLHRHKSHEERRIAWRMAHQAQPRKINCKRAMIARRNMALS